MKMKKTKVLVIMAVMMLVATVAAGCSKYKSKYFAVCFAHSNTSGSAFMNFGEFDGTMVFTLKTKKDGAIKYNAKLEKGSLTVYYDSEGTKEELFKLSAGESVSSSLENLPKGKVYIIVETDGNCKNGDLDFKVKKK